MKMKKSHNIPLKEISCEESSYQVNFRQRFLTRQGKVMKLRFPFPPEKIQNNNLHVQFTELYSMFDRIYSIINKWRMIDMSECSSWLYHWTQCAMYLSGILCKEITIESVVYICMSRWLGLNMGLTLDVNSGDLSMRGCF